VDNACTDCGTPIARHGALRCKSCAAKERWRLARAAGSRYGAKYPPHVCKRCGAEFPWEHYGRSAYCSPECRRNRVEKICKGCGDAFSVPVSNDARYTYCSRPCKAASGAEGSPVIIACAHCGGEVTVNHAKRDERRFCSNRCYRAHQGESSIERRTREVLDRLGVAYTAQAAIGKWTVDFLIGELVIECDGAYWHSLGRDTDERKSADLRDHGYDVLRLPESEILAKGFPSTLKRQLERRAALAA
jgi:very-short-patch-repair endonuclease